MKLGFNSVLFGGHDLETAFKFAQLTGYDGCFYCAGVSSVGMNEADYTVISHDTPLAFATTLGFGLANLVASLFINFLTLTAEIAEDRRGR